MWLYYCVIFSLKQTTVLSVNNYLYLEVVLYSANI
jgi:hypothetical protein